MPLEEKINSFDCRRVFIRAASKTKSDNNFTGKAVTVREMNQNMDESVSSGISVTPAARSKITELLANADESQSAVRVFVSGGGCGGMSYGMTFAESIADKDRLMKDEEGFALTIDPIAFSYLQGAEIDFQDSDVNATFVFNNVFQAVGGSGACGGCGGAH